MDAQELERETFRPTPLRRNEPSAPPLQEEFDVECLGLDPPFVINTPDAGRVALVDLCGLIQYGSCPRLPENNAHETVRSARLELKEQDARVLASVCESP